MPKLIFLLLCSFLSVKDVYGYFRAIMKTGEKSERVLELTADAVDCNPANYTVWYVREPEGGAYSLATPLYGEAWVGLAKP